MESNPKTGLPFPITFTNRRTTNASAFAPFLMHYPLFDREVPIRIAEVGGAQTTTQVIAAYAWFDPENFTPVGAVTVDRDKGTVELVGVDDSMRRQGLATKLIEAARQYTGLPLDQTSSLRSQQGTEFGEASGIGFTEEQDPVDSNEAERWWATLAVDITPNFNGNLELNWLDGRGDDPRQRTADYDERRRETPQRLSYDEDAWSSQWDEIVKKERAERKEREINKPLPNFECPRCSEPVYRLRNPGSYYHSWSLCPQCNKIFNFDENDNLVEEEDYPFDDIDAGIEKAIQEYPTLQQSRESAYNDKLWSLDHNNKSNPDQIELGKPPEDNPPLTALGVCIECNHTGVEEGRRRFFCPNCKTLRHYATDNVSPISDSLLGAWNGVYNQLIENTWENRNARTKYPKIQIDKDARKALKEFWLDHPDLRKGCEDKYGYDPINEAQQYWQHGLWDEPEHLELAKEIQDKGFTLDLAKRWMKQELKAEKTAAKTKTSQTKDAVWDLSGSERLAKTDDNEEILNLNGNKVITSDRDGELYVADFYDNLDLIDWMPAEEFVAQADPYRYVEQPDYSAEFWQYPKTLFHATSAENVESIQKEGLLARNETRGITNRFTGSAIFTTESDDPATVSYHYGDAVFAIDTKAMKQDGLMPPVEPEEPEQERRLRESLAWSLGMEWWQAAESWDGIMSDTQIVYGDIPAKYLQLVTERLAKTAAMTDAKLLEMKEQLEQQYGADQSKVIYEYPDGWTMREPSTYNDLNLIGWLMSNCLGYGSMIGDNEGRPVMHKVWDEPNLDDCGDVIPKDDPNYVTPEELMDGGLPDYAHRFVVLYDPKGIPRMAGEIPPEDTLVTDMRGRHNSDPKMEYIDRLTEFLDKEGDWGGGHEEYNYVDDPNAPDAWAYMPYSEYVDRNKRLYGKTAHHIASPPNPDMWGYYLDEQGNESSQIEDAVWDLSGSKHKTAAKTRTQLLQDAQQYPDTSEIVQELSDGWTIRRPVSSEDLDREGQLMGNCIDRGYHGPNSDVMSLRDPDNLPRASLWAGIWGGRHNDPIKPEYYDKLVEYDPSLADHMEICPRCNRANAYYFTVDDNLCQDCHNKDDNNTKVERQMRQQIENEKLFRAAKTAALVTNIEEVSTSGGAYGKDRPVIYDMNTGTIYVGRNGSEHWQVYSVAGLKPDPNSQLQMFISPVDMMPEYNKMALERIGLSQEAVDQIGEELVVWMSKQKTAQYKIASRQGMPIHSALQHVGMAVNDDWWQSFIEENPYAYHGTDKWNLPSIKENGLMPDSSSQYQGFLTPSPHHVYLSANPHDAIWHSENHDDPILLSIDLAYLDPALVEADEDFAAANAKEFGIDPPINPYDEGSTYDSWDGPTKAEWYENNRPENDEDISQASTQGSFAYRGVIPPEAISWPDAYSKNGSRHLALQPITPPTQPPPSRARIAPDQSGLAHPVTIVKSTSSDLPYSDQFVKQSD